MKPGVLGAIRALAVVLLVATPCVDAQSPWPDGSGPARTFRPVGPEQMIDAEWQAFCLRYSIAIEGGSDRNGTISPLGECDDATVIDLEWDATKFHGEGSLQFDLAPRDAAAGGFRTLSDEVVVVETDLAGALGRLLGIHEASEPFQPAGAPENSTEAVPERLVVRARFFATWLAPDCADARGEFEVEANGERMHVLPSETFFQGLCALARPDPPGDPLPAVVAEALLAVADADLSPPTLDRLRAFFALVTMAEPPRAVASTAIAGPRIAAPAPDVAAPERETAAAQGELALLAAPQEGEVAAQEEVRAAAVVVDLRQGSRIDVGRGVVRSPSPEGSDRAVSEDGTGGGQRAEASPDDEETLPIPLSFAALAPSEAPGGRPPALTRIRDAYVLREEVSPLPPDASAALVGLAAASALLALVGVALYQRVARPRALDHPARGALHAAAIARGAAATASELAADAGLDRKTAEYHLRYLARLGLLREERAPDEPRRFAPPAAPRRPATQGVDARLLAALGERPGMTAPQAARLLGLTLTRTDERLKGLVLRGALESQMREGERRFFLGPAPST